MASFVDSFSRRLNSSAEQLTALADAMEEWMNKAGVETKTSRYVGLMLDELMANIAKHAYQGLGTGVIEVAADFHERVVTVSLRDYGPAFDPTLLAPANTGQDLDHREIGGLGVHFVRHIADSFSYCRDGHANEVVFSKQVQNDASGMTK